MFTIEGKEYGIRDRDWDAHRKVYDARRYTILTASRHTMLRAVFYAGEKEGHRKNKKRRNP